MSRSPFDSPYHPLRAYLTQRATYLLLAFDCWLGMVQHGGRYGLGFNVTHFAFLDALLPVPEPSAYVALIVCSGFVSLSLALFGGPRWLRALLASSYSAAWLISLHDSYQHHYFLSWVLIWMACLPDLPEPDGRDARARITGWELPMTSITCAIVYTFTGIAKSEGAWRSGDVLRAIAHARGAPHWGLLEPLRPLLTRLGVGDGAFWTAFAYATIALQWSIALGYLSALRRDASASAVASVTCTIALLGALGFHLTAELSGGFEIGLFSYYMGALAVAMLAPLWLLLPLGHALAVLRERVGRWDSSPERHIVRQALIVLMLAGLGALLPIPGTLVASCALAALTALRMWRVDAAQRTALALQTAFCSLLMWLTLSQGSVAFDYYRRLAGELRRMDRLEEALHAYRQAERHAPAGKTRAATIRELEAELRKRR